MISGAAKCLCALGLAGWLAVPGLGCGPELFPPLGNIDSFRQTRPQQTPSGFTSTGARSEWEIMREAVEPARGIDDPGAAHESQSGAGDSGGEREYPASSPPSSSAGEALVLVDREHGLPRGYVPEDLVPLSPRGIPTVGVRPRMLREEAAGATALLVADAASDGVELAVRSAYRSHADQVASYSRWSMVHGEGAGGFSAPPGHSEHQLGTVVDLTNARVGYKLVQRFGYTEASRWLRGHAARYGFVLSYPPESETGYRWEPWHYRYIGEKNAIRYIEGDFESPRRFLLEEGVRAGGDPSTRPLVPGYHGRVAERWNESAALSLMKRAFEYVELRRDPETHDDTAEQEAIGRMRRAFEARDMRALRQATRHYIRQAPRDAE